MLLKPKFDLLMRTIEVNIIYLVPAQKYKNVSMLWRLFKAENAK